MQRDLGREGLGIGWFGCRWDLLGVFNDELLVIKRKLIQKNIMNESDASSTYWLLCII